jgi:lipopolysaccharide transport system permease protein
MNATPVIIFSILVVYLLSVTETRITPPKNLRLNLKELWQHRELFYFFAWRDIKVKYKQTLIGFVWAIIQPLMMMGILYFFIADRLASEGFKIPFLIYSLSGLIIWNIFSTGVTSAGNSMIQNANIIKKIYFPRLIIPGSALIVSLFDFIWAFLTFLVVSIVMYGFDYFSWESPLYFLSGILLVIISTIGLGNLIASLTIKYKDIRHALPFLMQLMLLGSSVIYPLSFIKNEYVQHLLAFNPCMGAVELFRMGINGYSTPMELIYINLGFNVLIFVVGLYNFRRTEQYLADTI